MPMWYDSVISKGVEPVRWLLVAAIACTLATTIWSFFDAPVSPSVSTSPSAAPASSPGRAPANVNWILSKHLFGEAGRAPAVDTASNEPAVQTRLPLELQSVFVADEDADSAAIVAQRGKPGKLYAVGETLPGNAKLEEVLTDRIILRRAGSRETLMFPKTNAQFIASPVEGEDETASEPAAANNTRSQAQSSRAPESATQPAAEPQTAETQDPMAVLETYTEKLAADAAGTLDELGIEAVDAAAGGGYRIGSVAQSPYLRQTGLQAGDVILSVNGRPVGDIEQDQMELANIMAQGSARIEVQRGSRRFFITASLSGTR